MEPTPRLYLCKLCHRQVYVCSDCDRGQIYCGTICSKSARVKSLRSARTRYQQTSSGKRNHAACQTRYRAKLKNKVMDHGSPSAAQDAPMTSLEKIPDKAKNETTRSTLCCCFCNKPISEWSRIDFLRQRGHKKSMRAKVFPQAL